jgi:tungstate transport system ATP-binding protein
MMIYELTDLTKAYSHRTVLKIPHLSIEKNRIYALLGPNGAGKTTLLNILGFLDAPTSGMIRYRSDPVAHTETALQALRRQVVVVHQHPILFTTSVFKNIEFGLKIRNISSKNRTRIIEEALDLVGMRAFAQSKAHRLSGGETQRVALARALALSPEVFLCDEPTASVDAENQAIIINLLRQINATQKISIIFTTHDRTQAAGIAHQTLVLDHGQLIHTGYDNIFSAVIGRDSQGKMVYHLTPTVSLLAGPEETGPAGRRVRIFIDPFKIKLCPGAEAQKASGKTVLQGQVRQVMLENGTIRIMMDSDIWITVMLSPEKYRKYGLLVGDVIHYTISPEAIQTTPL